MMSHHGSCTSSVVLYIGEAHSINTSWQALAQHSVNKSCCVDQKVLHILKLWEVQGYIQLVRLMMFNIGYTTEIMTFKNFCNSAADALDTYKMSLLFI